MKKKLALTLTGLLLMGTLAGCSIAGSTAQSAYISMDNACAAALKAAGLDADSADAVSAPVAQRDGIAYYEVELTAEGRAYTYYIDAVTGVVIDKQGEDGEEALPAGADEVTDFDTEGAAPVLPEKSSDEVTDFDTTGSPEPPAQKPEPSAPPVSTASVGTEPQPQQSTEITLEKAKEIALSHAGKTAAEADFVKAKKDHDDGNWVYEIEFIVTSGSLIQEYDYEISLTGEILSYDSDAEDFTPKSDQSSAAKTEEEVRGIALAKVPGASSENCRMRLERDDGRLIYEGKIVYQGMEYEFEIDAYSGTVLEWDADPIDD